MVRKVIAAALLAVAAVPAAAQEASVERITVHGESLEGNLEGNDATREVMVVLPPSYATSPERRYPVLYHLHGFTSTAGGNLDGIEAQAALNALAAEGAEMILVLPDAHTRHAGAMYSNSPTTGDFERFVTGDLVDHIDANYRTLPVRESRGLAGHSMGGYGTIKLAMRHPQVYSSIYAMSPCCLVPQVAGAEQLAQMRTMTPEQIEAGGFFLRAAFASLAAWAPAPDNPPYYIDFGVREDGTVDPVFAGRIAANAPIVMLPQHLAALESLEGFAIDIGDEDFLLESAQAFRTALQRFGVEHQWQLYDGDHVNRIAPQFRSAVLPFFAARLDGAGSQP